jgi:hypothetical protein
MHRPPRPHVVAAIALAAVVLVGCSPPPWQDPKFAKTPGPKPSASASVVPALVRDAPSPTPSPIALLKPTPTPAPAPAPTVHDDLARGSAKHVLDAGPTSLTLRYWSTLSKEDWTWGATKPLTIAVSATGESRVSLTAARVAVDQLTASGWVAVPGQSPAVLPVSGNPSIASPASSTLTSLLSAVDRNATALRYTVVVEISVGAWNGVSSSYSATDTLTVALSP